MPLSGLGPRVAAVTPPPSAAVVPPTKAPSAKQTVMLAPSIVNGSLTWSLQSASAAAPLHNRWSTSPRAARPTPPTWRKAGERPNSARATTAGVLHYSRKHTGTPVQVQGQVLHMRKPPAMPEAYEGAQAAAAYVEDSRGLLERFRAKEADLSINAQGAQSWMQEKWSELHAWCGFLAGNLEGSCRRIEMLGEEKRQLESSMSDLKANIRFLEHLCSQRNVHTLEQKAEALQGTIDEFSSVRSELDLMRERLGESEEQRMRQVNAHMANDAANTSLRSQLDHALAERATILAERDAERDARKAAEESAERAQAEAQTSHTVARKARERQASLEEELRAAHGRLDAALAEAAAGHARARASEEQKHERTRAELAHMHHQLTVETAARIKAEQHASQAQHDLDAALNACKQSADALRSHQAKAGLVSGAAGSSSEPFASIPPAPSRTRRPPPPPARRPASAPHKPSPSAPSNGVHEV